MAEELKTWDEYPNPHFKGITKDLDRTFPIESFFTDEVK